MPWNAFLATVASLGRGLDWVFESRSGDDLARSLRFLAGKREIAALEALGELAERFASLPALRRGAP